MAETGPEVSEPPGTFEELRNAISERHPGLSKRLQQIAKYALAHPNDMALETVATVAERAGIQPSALIRFAKAFGYAGFSDMQRVFQYRLVDRVPSYAERIRRLQLEETGGPLGILDHFVEAGIGALQHLRDEASAERLEEAVAMMTAARTVHLMGQRRAFPVVCYLAYGLSGLGVGTGLIDGVGGMMHQQARAMRPGDALVAVSFRPYSPDTLEVMGRARDMGLPVLAITDDPLSPVGPLATLTLEVQDAEVRSFRSLTATMCLAMSLVVGVGRHLDMRRDG